MRMGEEGEGGGGVGRAAPSRRLGGGSKGRSAEVQERQNETEEKRGSGEGKEEKCWDGVDQD